MIATEAGYVPPTAAPVIIREFRRDANDEKVDDDAAGEDGAAPKSDAVTQLQEEAARLQRFGLRFEFAGPQSGPYVCTATFGARARACDRGGSC